MSWSEPLNIGEGCLLDEERVTNSESFQPSSEHVHVSHLNPAKAQAALHSEPHMHCRTVVLIPSRVATRESIATRTRDAAERGHLKGRNKSAESAGYNYDTMTMSEMYI